MEDFPGLPDIFGHATPTANAADKRVKGYVYDDDGGGKAYWWPDELRQIAAQCIAAADWLERRTDDHDID